MGHFLHQIPVKVHETDVSNMKTMTMIGGDGRMLSRFISAHLEHKQVPISQAGQATQKTFLPFVRVTYKPEQLHVLAGRRAGLILMKKIHASAEQELSFSVLLCRWTGNSQLKYIYLNQITVLYI